MEIHKLNQDEFPAQLMETPEPPKELWRVGELPPYESVLLTVVGARKHSAYGREACETLIAGLAGYDITIVSGLALGIDTIAHRAAMNAGLRTIAVPGSGLDPKVLYPRSNVRLAEEIVASGGALLSEFSPQTGAAPWTFPKRNRIMAGLAKATLVIEAEQRSGTLITSRLATDYNRDVLAVPGEIFSPLSAGPNMLIALGATPIHESADLIRALGFAFDEQAASERDYSGLSEDERAVIEALSSMKFREQLIDELGCTPSEGNILLMKMEIAGLITETAHGIRRV
jgi:DNA processing protein